MKDIDVTVTSELLKSLTGPVKNSIQDLRDKELTLGFAESCTGGLLSSLFTEHAGVSSVFQGSVVSYSNDLKIKFLGVKSETLKAVGAVSSETAQQMAQGCVKQLGVRVGVSLTGIAGPDGGTPLKPVGTVFIAVAGTKSADSKNGELITKVFEHHFSGDRKQVQLQACAEAVKHLTDFIKAL